ncbi:MAG: hypothetical protein KC615_25090, partial [Anaerolineae bacterium]|nr:hypothetical protein [Anaerolineae bacterium]
LYEARELAIYQAHNGGVDAVSFSPTGSVLASSGRDNTIRFWDTTTGEMVNSIEAHRKPVMALDFNPVGTMLASASGDNTVSLWVVNAS